MTLSDPRERGWRQRRERMWNGFRVFLGGGNGGLDDGLDIGN